MKKWVTRHPIYLVVLVFQTLHNLKKNYCAGLKL